jgi:hypothetical protein
MVVVVCGFQRCFSFKKLEFVLPTLSLRVPAAVQFAL